MTKEEIIKKIVQAEWETFDKVINEGGRADCQDNPNTFNIMRTSQFLAWPDELLAGYLDDIEMAMKVGENIISYKYGYMMESTCPAKYSEIKDKLPAITDSCRAVINSIVEIQVGWMEEFAAKYPKLAKNSRTIHSSEDTEWDTSAETYLRGELMTYSDRTLKLYGAFIVDIAKKGGNLTQMIMENTVHMYGYDSLEQAEEKM